MHRYLTYAGVFVTLVLIQIFLIDNISLGIYFHPLIYIAFLIILPLDTKPVWVVLLSALLGLTIDSMTGLGGLNVIATTATGFLRGSLLGVTSGHNTSTDDAIPSLYRLTNKNLAWFIALVILLHSSIYFLFEALSLHHIFRTLLRIILSGAGAGLFVWFFVKLFIEKIFNK